MQFGIHGSLVIRIQREASHRLLPSAFVAKRKRGIVFYRHAVRLFLEGRRGRRRNSESERREEQGNAIMCGATGVAQTPPRGYKEGHADSA